MSKRLSPPLSKINGALKSCDRRFDQNPSRERTRRKLERAFYLSSVSARLAAKIYGPKLFRQHLSTRAPKSMDFNLLDLAPAPVFICAFFVARACSLIERPIIFNFSRQTGFNGCAFDIRGL